MTRLDGGRVTGAANGGQIGPPPDRWLPSEWACKRRFSANS
jgi:hypothetical protein